jgi:hypothetical protein
VVDGDSGVEKTPVAPARAVEAALVVSARRPATSSIDTAPEFTATVPRPTPVVAVIPSRRSGP